MNINRQEFIIENYIIAWQHPDAVESDWNTFLLEEAHDDEQVRQINGAFISHFSPPGSVLAVEGEYCLVRSIFPKKDLQEFFINTPHIPAENIIGWDKSDCLFHSTVSGMVCWILHKFENTFMTSLETFDWQDKMLNALPQEIQTDLNMIAEIGLAAKKMQKFFEEEIIVLEKAYLREKQLVDASIDEITKCDHAFASLLKKSLNQDKYTAAIEMSKEEIQEQEIKFKTAFIVFLKNYPEKEYLITNYIEALGNCSKLRSQRFIKIQKKIRKCLDKRALLTTKKFPQRTSAMIKTLQNVQSFITSDKGVVHLIAGARHLEESSDTPIQEKEFYSLNILYSFLKEHKNIVILRPKILT